MTFNWYEILKRNYESGKLEIPGKTAEQRLVDAVAQGLITDEQRIEIVGEPV